MGDSECVGATGASKTSGKDRILEAVNDQPVLAYSLGDEL